MHRLNTFRWTAFVMLVLALVLEVVNGRFRLNDLRVYVMAADALRHGQQVYGVPFGLDTGYFKYAPAFLYLFVPATFLPFMAVCTLHFALIGTALVSVVVRMERILMRHVLAVHAPRPGLRAMLAFLCVALHLTRELHLGNVNLLLLWCVVAGLEAMLDDDHRLGGVLLGAAVLVKPYLGLVLLPLVMTGGLRALPSALLTLMGGILLPLLVQGPAGGIALTKAWLQAMQAHDTYLGSTHTLRSLLGTTLGRPLPGWSDLLLLAVVTATLVAGVRSARRSGGEHNALVFGSAWALAAIPLLVVTDVQHFLLALPLISWCLARLFHQRRMVLAGLFTLGMLAYGTDSTDLWGRELADRLTQAGTVGWGDLVLLITSMALVRPPKLA
jgi:hypothetical protein